VANGYGNYRPGQRQLPPITDEVARKLAMLASLAFFGGIPLDKVLIFLDILAFFEECQGCQQSLPGKGWHPSHARLGNEHATKDFMRWRPAEAAVHVALKSRTRLSRRKRALPTEEPHGCPGGSVSEKKASHDCRGGNVNGHNRPTTGYAGERQRTKRAHRERRSGRAARVAAGGATFRLTLPEEVSPTLERQAQERWRARSPTLSHRADPLESAAPSSSGSR
jgi:hypothetical protein